MTTIDNSRGNADALVGAEAANETDSGSVRPQLVDRLVVHQFDAARPSPGGIDTCIRGLCRYAPLGTTIAIVGVDAGGEVSGRRLGAWERHDLGGRQIWFMPVATLDPSDQRRLVPHSLRLMAGVARYRARLPRARVVQAHRADTAMALRTLLGRPLAYFIHTQEAGLTSATSDSIWRFAKHAHAAVERSLVGAAEGVVVFNPDYAKTVQQHNSRAIFSPTWFDPAIVRGGERPSDPYRVVWVGRLEEPKDPSLALEAFGRLLDLDSGLPWTLEFVGAGTLADDLAARVAALPDDVAARVRLRGRLAPEAVAEVLGGSGVFLMTSHAGYEGFPRVLVEALASGLPAVVTEGSDTGGMITSGENGLVTDRDPRRLAAAIARAVTFDRHAASQSARAYGAPQLVGRIFDATSPAQR
ncbi:glycosyltransferase family 4 protein [Pengzhenrongella sp.]|jgi:glycosyltransferase involved in cell wall biosynthesis|uniref:glycosyltransferase family 4 protein n=1 Tax=Pengzhenrongella sp. TaxID=2888820 RepID=UPI002F9360CF